MAGPNKSVPCSSQGPDGPRDADQCEAKLIPAYIKAESPGRKGWDADARGC